MEAPASTPSSDNANSNSQIQPNIEIDVNQAIPQVTGGNVFANVTGNVTIYHSPEAVKAVTNKDLKIGANPYKGLLAFQETDGDRFFGRDLQIKELWEKFRSLYEDGSQARLLTIYGPSGSGKSSLARAGLIPEMGRRYLAGYEQARVVVVIPKTHPLESLALGLARVATNDPTPADKTNEFLGTLVKVNAEGSYEGLRQIANMLPRIEISPLIVLVDQFEEVFTQCKDSDERNAFISNLLCAAADRSKQVSLILTLRSDFLGMTQTYQQLNQLIATQGFLVAVMDKVGLRDAIAKPAELAKHPLDLSTIDRLIEQTADREGALPLLQFALERIWAGLIEGKEPAETLQAIGGVGGALAGEAQRIYGSLTTEEQGIARRVFLGLVQLGEGAKDTRRRIELERLVSHRDSLEQVKEVIDKFANRDTRLITLSNEGGAETAEVTHEALFDNWQQLKDWLDGGRSDLRFQRRLDDSVMVWQENGRPDGSLWRFPDLDLLQDYKERAGDDLTPSQLEFFQTSIDAEHELDQKQLQTEKRIATITEIAELTKLLAEKDLAAANWTAALKQKQQRQVLIGVMSIGLLLTSGAAVFSLFQVQQVQRQRVTQLATNAQVLLASNDTVGAVINAIAAKGLSQSAFVRFPDYPQFASVDKTLLDAISHNREQNQLVHGFEAHVYSVAYSPDGQHIVSGGNRQALQIWDAKTGTPIGESLLGHEDRVTSVAYSPDSLYIVSGSSDKTLRIWDAKTGTPIGKPLQGHADEVISVAYSPDGQYIISGSWDKTLRIWDAKTGTPIGKPLQGHKSSVVSVAYSTDGLNIVSGSWDKTLRIWDAKTGTPIGKPLQGHEDTVTSVAYSPDGLNIVSGSGDKTLRIWDAKTGIPIGKPLQGHKSGVISVKYSPDGRYIISGSGDKTVRIWDSKRGTPIGEPLFGHEADVNSVAYSPDGQYIISGGYDNTVRIWDKQMGDVVNEPLEGHQDSINSVAYSPDGQYIISGSDDKTVKIWDAKTEAPIGKPLLGHKDRVRSIAYSPDGKHIVSGSDDKTVRIWNAKTGTPVGQTLLGHEANVISVKYSSDGQRIISRDSDNTVKIWNTLSGISINKSVVHGKDSTILAYSPNGKLIVSSGDSDNTAVIWNALTGKHVGKPMQGHQDTINSVAFSPDGKYIVSGSTDKTVRLWDAHTGSPISSPLLGHKVKKVNVDEFGEAIRAGVNSVAYSPDGQQIIAGSSDRTIRIWDVSKKHPDSWDNLLHLACNRLRYHPTVNQPETDVAHEAKQTCEQYVWKK